MNFHFYSLPREPTRRGGLALATRNLRPLRQMWFRSVLLGSMSTSCLGRLPPRSLLQLQSGCGAASSTIFGRQAGLLEKQGGRRGGEAVEVERKTYSKLPLTSKDVGQDRLKGG